MKYVEKGAAAAAPFSNIRRWGERRACTRDGR